MTHSREVNKTFYDTAETLVLLLRPSALLNTAANVSSAL